MRIEHFKVVKGIPQCLARSRCSVSGAITTDNYDFSSGWTLG